MTGEEFCRDLERQVYASLDRIAVASAAHEPASNIDIAAMLVGALKSEIEASEEAALWISSTPELDVKLALARQCGDEAKHYRLIEDRLRQMGRDPSEIDPLADGYTPMFHFLEGLQTTAERLAAGQFTREGLAKCGTKSSSTTAGPRAMRRRQSCMRTLSSPTRATTTSLDADSCPNMQTLRRSSGLRSRQPSKRSSLPRSFRR